MKLLCLLLTILLSSGISMADNYEVSVTRKGSNLYKVDGENIFVHTRYCYEYVYYENAILKMNGNYGEIVFIDSGEKCDVSAVYGQSDQPPGNYSVTISRKDNDWYEVWGSDVYIKTSGCLSLALGEEAILKISAGGYGTLIVGGNQCMVEGVFAKLKL